MSIVIHEITDNWAKDEPIYQKIGKIFCEDLKRKLFEIEIMADVSYRTKELLSIIKKIKKKQQEKEYSYNSLTDKLGVRIICVFEFELNEVDRLLKEICDIKSVEYKKDILEYDALGYQSNHYDVTVKPQSKKFRSINQIEGYIFEIQVRTLNQHAWSNAAHQLSYKQDVELPKEMKRRLYRLLSLYELADQEIDLINKFIKSQNSNMPMNGILQNIEGKFYKFAKIDYDREISALYLDGFSRIFDDEQIEEISIHIHSFLTENEKRIENIYRSNSCRFHEVLSLTQPEIFIAWYALDKFEYTLSGNWNNYFDTDELEQIKNLWGVIID